MELLSCSVDVACVDKKSADHKDNDDYDDDDIYDELLSLKLDDDSTAKSTPVQPGMTSYNSTPA